MIDAVGMEAHGAPVEELAQKAAGLLPKPVAAKATEKIAVDRMEVLYNAIDAVSGGERCRSAASTAGSWIRSP